MAITTVTYDVLTDSGITYESIGLSDTLDNYTLEEILDYTYCGEYDVLKRNVMINSPNTPLEAPSLLDNLNIPITFTSNNPLRWEVGQGDYTNPDGLFGRILWLKTDGTYADVITEDNADDYKLITSWTATKYYFTIPTLKQGWITASRAATSWNDNKTYPCLYWTGNDKGALKFHSKYGQAGDVEFSLSYQPYIIAEAREGSYILYNLNQGENIHTWYGARNVNIYGSPNNFADGNLISFDKAATYSIVYAAREWFGDAGTDKDLRDYPNGNELPFNWNMGRFNELLLSQTVVGDQYLMFCSSGGSQYNAYAGIRYWTYPSVKHDSLLFWANAGVYFIADNTVYKPIISNNIVTDYSDDLTTESDYDNYDGKTKHDSSPTPPTPSGGDDDIDSMGFDGMSCNVGGPAKYYIMSYSDIHHLIGDFNTHAEPGTSISNNIISCYVNALDWNWSTGSETIEIYSGGAQTAAFTSDMNYSVLTGYNARDIIGSIDVPRMTNTFYDFSPYSTYEVYIPFCGWVALPDTVAGRHIKIYFETDEATCGCKGRVFFVDSNGNGVTVAEITGSFGAPCPIQVIEGGLYKGAMLSNGLQVIGGIASGVMGGASGSGFLAVGGLSNAMQGLGNCLVAGNTNYGQTIGRAGDASGLMCAGKPYLKITYPPIDEVVNNNMFAHTVGYLCNTIGQLSNFHGFTVCANPHVHISATSTEKEEIKQLLEQGVILP